MICVIATIEVAAGQRDALLELFRPLIPRVRAEKGCLEYALMIDTPSGLPGEQPVRPNAVVMVEKWESLAALQAHLKTIHMAECSRQAEELQATVQLQILEPV
jgi:quinol monooxygenase YgiN